MKITRDNLLESIPELERIGFRRWTKNGHDRLYIDARALGLNPDTRTFKGDKISGGVCSAMATAKTYIDLTEYMVVSDNCDLAYEVAAMLDLDTLRGGVRKMEIR